MNTFLEFLSNFEAETKNEKLLLEVIGALISTVERQRDQIKVLDERPSYTGGII